MANVMDLPNKGTILIIPAVSSANVPQLALDLLVHSLRLPFAGVLDHAGLLYPFAGPRETPLDENSRGISSSLEVYHNEHISCLTQRSPTLPGSRLLFITKVIMPFIQQNQFSHILLLSSSDASRRSDPRGPKATTISLWDRSADGISTPTIVDLSRKIAQLSVSDSPRYEEYSLPTRLPGSGITLPFLKEAVSRNLPVSCIIQYAYDGDNIDDAYYMAELALHTLQIQSPSQKWTQPPSWKGVYGKEQQMGLEHGLYG